MMVYYVPKLGLFLTVLFIGNVFITALQYEPMLGGKVEDHQIVSATNRISGRSILGVERANAAAAGYLLFGPLDDRLNSSDPIDRHLLDILDRNGPDMRPSRDYKDFKDIPLNVSMRAWGLYHDYATDAISNRIDFAWPAIHEILVSANVSNKCQMAALATMDGAKRMESWALRLMNAWGSFPMSGMFEGTYGDVGGWDQCVNINDNIHIDHAHYCSMTFRPVMPSSKDYELVLRREPIELREMFERNKASLSVQTNKLHPNGTRITTVQLRDAFSDLLYHAQYHHYVYYKWGSCWPIDCSPFDVKRVTRLLGKRNFLSNGPVKCYSKNEDDYDEPEVIDNYLTSNENVPANVSQRTTRKLVMSTWDKNDGIFIWKPHFKRPHKIALSIVLIVTTFILAMTLIDLVCNKLPGMRSKLGLALRGLPLDHSYQYQVPRGLPKDQFVDGRAGPVMGSRRVDFTNRASPQGHSTARIGFSVVSTAEDDIYSSDDQPPISTFMSVVDDCSILTNARQFFRVSEGQMKNDILCLNGIRCITMIWILLTHTMMYYDWSEFGRTREVEKSLDNLMSQPLFNGSYLVDTFFLMSGLLSSLTAFKHCQGLKAKFNSFAYIFGRWLRLTPQIFFISMIYIFFPTLSSGPHWYPLVSEYSENCVKHWWVNVLHLQAFYKKEEMCNFVTWWISIDFFYHFFALAIIWVIILLGHRCGFFTIAGIVVGGMTWQCFEHFRMSLPPNVFSTIPQSGAMWTKMTLDFFWTPYTHVIPFFFGFYIGYLIALKKKLILRQLNTRRSLVGWVLSISLLLGQSYATYWWLIGKADYSRLVSTIYYTICAFIWSASLCWIIIACHHGYGGFINNILSSKIFIVLGKASYLVYLSHFLILFLYYGNQSLLLEPTPVVMFYIIIGNIFLSTLFGVFLCIVYELPWLKAQRRLMKYV